METQTEPQDAAPHRRDTDHYKEEYVTAFVDKWDELIDWDARAESEGRFFIETLRQHGAAKILETWFTSYKGPGVITSRGFAGADSARATLEAAAQAFEAAAGAQKD